MFPLFIIFISLCNGWNYILQKKTNSNHVLFNHQPILNIVESELIYHPKKLIGQTTSIKFVHQNELFLFTEPTWDDGEIEWVFSQNDTTQNDTTQNLKFCTIIFE